MSKPKCTWYADDKDIHDILMSSKRKVTTKLLLRLARERGIFFSANCSREQLAYSLSLLNFDRKQIDNLLDSTSSKDRIEKMASVELVTTLPLNDILAVVEKIKERIIETSDEVIQVRPSGNGITIEIQYTEIDESLTRLTQKQVKDVSIEIESTRRGVRIRHPVNGRAESILGDIERAIAGKAERRCISNIGLPTPEMRTQFFIELMNGIQGYRYRDATVAHCERMAVEAQSEGGDESRSVEPQSPKQQAFAFESTIKKLALEGTGLLKSEEYRLAARRGLYINRVAWKSDDSNPDGKRVEFEADFAADGNLRYGVRGVYTRKKSYGEYNQTRVAAPPEEQRAFYRLLETAAQIAYDKITEVQQGLPPVPSADVNLVSISNCDPISQAETPGPRPRKRQSRRQARESADKNTPLNEP